METLERTLREHPFLRELDDDQIRFMAGCARNVTFEAGQFLHREGDDVSGLYLLRSGQLALEVHTPELEARGIRREGIFLSMEQNMECSVGLCGHCQYGPAFVCKDGPVFRLNQIAWLLARREI